MRGITAGLAALAGLLGGDALLFRTSLYPSWLEPNSSTGLFELVLHREQAAQRAHGDNLVVTLGDSRFGYAPRLANQWTAETGYVFRHAGLAGTNARSWYYMLRDLDPSARRYRAVVLGVDDYDDEDDGGDLSDDIRALHYTIARLRWSDVLDFAGSFHSRELQWEALRGACLKGMVYQADVRAFLTAPWKRIRYVRQARRFFETWTYSYVETTRSMAGLKIDWAAGKADLPADADTNQRETVDFLMRPPVPQTGRLAEFRRRWFGRILEHYRGSPTTIIFVRVPRGALARPADLVVKQSHSIRDFAAQPNVLLCNEHAFESLERPEYFKDGIHLNLEGSTRFSRMLAFQIAGLLRTKAAAADAL